MNAIRTLAVSAVLVGPALPGYALDSDTPSEPATDDATSESTETHDDATRLGTLDVRYSPDEIIDVGGSVQLVDEEDLETMRYEDPHDVLSQVGGVYVRTEDGYGLRPNIGMRGATSERSRKITLMEDGVLFGPAPYSAPAAYYFPLMLRMTGVEVFKGPSAVLYGPQTIGGAINYLTREVPDFTEGEVTIGAGTDLYGQLHLHHGMSNHWGGFVAELLHLRSSGFKELDAAEHTGFSRWEAMLKAEATLPTVGPVDHTFELKLGFSSERSNETYLGLSDADFARNPDRRYVASQDDRMEWERLQLQARYRLGFDIGALTTTAYRHTFSRDWAKIGGFGAGPSIEEVLADPEAGSRLAFYRLLTGQTDSTVGAPEETLVIGTNGRDFVSQGVQTHVRLGFGDVVESEIDAGVRLHYDHIVRNHTADGRIMQDRDLVDDGEPEAIVTRNKGATTALAVHALYSGTIGRFTFSPGVRMEWMQMRFEDRLADTSVESTDVVALPGLGLHFAITDALGVLAGVYRGFSPVSPGQPDEVTPEFSLNSEAGLRYQLPSGTSVSAIAFLNDYQNLTGACSFASGCDEQDLDRQFNAGRARILGAEFVAGHAFHLGGALWLPVQATWTYTSTEFLSDFDSDNPQYGTVEAGDELPYTPRHQGHLRIGVEEPEHWGAFVAATAVSKSREEAGSGDDGEFTDAWVRLDLSGRYRFWRTMTAHVRVDNVTNTRPLVSRRPYGARTIAPLSVRGSLSYAW